MRQIILLSILLLVSLAVRAQDIPYEKLDSISAVISKFQLHSSNLNYNDGEDEYALSFPDNNFQIFSSTGQATKVVNRKVGDTELVCITENIDLSKAEEIYQVEYAGNAGILRMSFPEGLTTQVYKNDVFSTSVKASYLEFFYPKNDEVALKSLLDQLKNMFILLELEKKIPKLQSLLRINMNKPKSVITKVETLDDIISKHIDAFGGAEKIRSVRTLVTESTIQTQGLNIPTKLWFLNNKGMRMDMDIQGQANITVTTANGSWTLFPIQKQKKPKDADAATSKEGAEELDMSGDLFDYKIKGNTVELLGKETLDGKEVYKIKIIRKSGTVINLILDAKTFLPSQRMMNKTLEGKITQVTEYISDYKKTAGGYVYASFYQYLPAGMNLRHSKYEINVPVDPKLFEKP